MIAVALATGLLNSVALVASAEEPSLLPELFLPVASQDRQGTQAAAAVAVGRYAVRLNPRLGDVFSLPAAIQVSLPDGTSYKAVRDNQMVSPDNSVTWVGSLEHYDANYRVIVTTGNSKAFGRILTPVGLLKVDSNALGTWLVDPQQAGQSPGPFYNDIAMPPRSGRPLSTSKAAVLPAASASSTVDAMLLYTPGMVSRYGSGLQTHLDHLVAVANQAYLDSRVNLTLRLVHSAQVNYSDAGSNEAALNALTDSATAALANVGTWRNQYGADLVALLRPLDSRTHEGCGIAWLNGIDGQALEDTYGYAVVSDGDDVGGSSYYCDDLTLTHEFGHNMGSNHDRAHAGGSTGAYPYSYGYGFEGTFGTIMSYINPVVGKFSSPNLSCPGNQACGVADREDNARSINNTRDTVANFRPAQNVTPPPSGSAKLIGISTRGWVGTGDSVMIGGFIISGSAAKKVLIMAKGPALADAGVPSVLNDPNLTLYNANGQVMLSNDNWNTAPNASEIQTYPAKPRYNQEAAILTTLNPGAYTAIVRGTGSTTGNALVEVYDVQ